MAIDRVGLTRAGQAANLPGTSLPSPQTLEAFMRHVSTVEEVAFRGYMQTGIERHDRENAIWITSLVFVASHITQGIGAVLVMGPGLFIASMLYGTLARRTGTILPGIVIHVLGDLARVYFGVLHGDGGLLFVK